MLKIALTVIIALTSVLQAPVYAGDAFELTMQFYYCEGSDQNVYYAPPGNTVKIKGGYPRPFKVILKNITSSSQSLNVDEASQGLGLITFEVTDENGNNNVVTRKFESGKSRSEGYNYIMPGMTKEYEIVMTEGEWNNAYKLRKQGATKFKARVAYKNGFTTIYSDYYTLILDE